MKFVSVVVRSPNLTAQSYTDRHSTRALPNEVKNISLEKLPLLDLHGQPVNLAKLFDPYLLLIFLRHLA